MHFFIQYSIFIAQKTPVSGEVNVWRDAGEGAKWASAYVRALQQKRRRKEKKKPPKKKKPRRASFLSSHRMISELILTVEGGFGCFTGSLDSGVLLLVVDSDLGDTFFSLYPLRASSYASPQTFQR